MWLVAVLAVHTGTAGICLSANANSVADLDVLDVLANADRLSYDLVANAARIWRGEPAGRKSVGVGAANTA